MTLHGLYVIRGFHWRLGGGLVDISLPLQIDNHLPRILYHTLFCMDEQLGLAGPRLLIVNRIFIIQKFQDNCRQV